MKWICTLMAGFSCWLQVSWAMEASVEDDYLVLVKDVAIEPAKSILKDYQILCRPNFAA